MNRSTRLDLTGRNGARAAALPGCLAEELAAGRRATTLVKESGESVPLLGQMPSTLDDVFGHFIDGILEITADCASGDTVQVVDL